ncbi:hypothetical protein JTE90_016769 [Oedothorax gibbosus]|uniref:Uncharacterized protein n=1 Tax=Oedothorax gibbosus TaxID=931172 RepID=A0AAV6W0A4_9ARAC|nr:hypothetical protein JTE90_016769 [Oedothorax gibbosus]
MRQSRMEDTRTIRHLQEQMRRYGPSRPSSPPSHGEDAGPPRAPKVEAVTLRWLQRTVSGLRQEMRELAVAVNTSAALAERQESATQLGLVRADVAALGHARDAARSAREGHAAALAQLAEEVREMRRRGQEAAAAQQRILIEVETLKEELREQVLIAKKKNFIRDASNEISNRGSRSHNAEHLRFRHSHWKVEVENLQEAVNNLEFSQADLSKQLQVLIKHQAAQLVKLSTVERNQSEEIDSEKTITNQRLNTLENLVNKTEEQTLNIQSRVNNITSSGIQKLHGSTMELFNALERLESSYDRKTDDIRKEISKLDSNLSQTQSDLEQLKERGLSSEEQLQSDLIGLRSDVKSNRIRILLLQNSVRNRTSQEVKLSNLESQIQSLTDHVGAEKMEIEALHKQIMADEQSQRKVRESILELNRVKRQQEEVDEKLNMLLAEFPKGKQVENKSFKNTWDFDSHYDN